MGFVTVNCTWCGKQFDKRSNNMTSDNHFCTTAHFYEFRRKQWAETRCLVPCVICGKEVERKKKGAKRYDATTCSRACLNTYLSVRAGPSIKTNCAACGREIERRPDQFERSKRHYCNRICGGRWQSEHQIGENHPMWRNAQVTFQCTYCKAGFQALKGERRGKRKYCSKECATNDGRAEAQCGYCGNGLTVWKWKVLNRKRVFCNKQCMNKWNSENKSGEQHHLWKGGRVPYYGPNWNAVRRKVRERDGYRCQHCGMTQEENGRELDVHHLTPIRAFGYKVGENDNYKQANQMSNLISLCMSCHRRAEHGKIRLRRKSA